LLGIGLSKQALCRVEKVTCIPTGYTLGVPGLAIFPIVFAVGLDPAAGQTLMFQTLATAFHTCRLARWSRLRSSSCIFAAITSSISLLEVTVAWLTQRFGVGRFAVSVSLGFFAIGLLWVFAFDIWADPPTACVRAGFEEANWLRGSTVWPAESFCRSGLVTAIFVGWIADRKLVDSECPLAVALILVTSLFSAEAPPRASFVIGNVQASAFLYVYPTSGPSACGQLRPPVPIFILPGEWEKAEMRWFWKWRARKDSNLRPPDS
jgi:SNF family Na+-dependent transporter